MAKDIFSKIMKDYDNDLERILEKKDFSSDVKNLLLSMLYKIENAYEDYSKVKVNVCSKNKFVEEILETIEKRCNKIEFIKPTSADGQELFENKKNSIIDKETGSIQIFQNEKSMLDALIQLGQKDIELKQKYDLIEEPIKDLLTIGNNMNSIEVIRDFNGWSWDISNKELQIPEYNIIYQMLIILIGNKIIDTWVNNRKDDENDINNIPSNMILGSKYNEVFGITKQEIKEEMVDYIEIIKENFKSMYGEKLEKEFSSQLQKTIIFICAKYNAIYKKKVTEEYKNLKEKLQKMNDKKNYLEELSKQKIELTKEIKDIDRLLNNSKDLKEEYLKRNSKLKDEEKIFSTSHLKIMLEKQRNKNIDNIQKINKIMEPIGYVNTKNEIEEKVKYFEDIEIVKLSNEKQEELLKKLNSIFYKCLEIKIEKAEEKKQIENLIYEMRYYKILSETKNTRVEEKLINKACSQKVIVTFSSNEKLNYNIAKKIFETRIIDLDTIVMVLKYNKGILKIRIYDGNVEDETVEIKITEKVELSVKLNKKIKVWE